MAKLVRLSEPTIDSSALGDFNRIPNEILKLIMDNFDLNNMLQLKLVCHSFLSMMFKFYGYIIYFPYLSESNFHSSRLHNAHKKFIQPLRVPQIMSIEPDKSVKELYETELPIRSLGITHYEMLPSWVNTSQVCSLLLSSNGSIDSNKVLDFLKAHKFPNVKAMTIHSIKLLELLSYCTRQFTLEYLNITRCIQIGRLWLSRSFITVREFVLTLDCSKMDQLNFHCTLPKNLEKCTIHFENEASDTEACNLRFHIQPCKLLKYL